MHPELSGNPPPVFAPGGTLASGSVVGEGSGSGEGEKEAAQLYCQELKGHQVRQGPTMSRPLICAAPDPRLPEHPECLYRTPIGLAVAKPSCPFPEMRLPPAAGVRKLYSGIQPAPLPESAQG